MRPAVGIAVVAMTLLTASPRDLSAQDSQCGMRGLGTPGRWESVRARSSGGAFARFDALSPLMEAPLADISTLTATAAGGTSHRDAQLGDTITQLRATRFPLMGVAGRVAPRLVVAGGFTTYLDRSWDVTLRDSTVLRGELERYRDEITSDGSVGDIRLAAASRLSRRLAIGAGIHILAGSTRMTAVRRFDDSTFHTVGEVAEVRDDGVGGSGGVPIGVASGLTLAGWARADNPRRAPIGGPAVAPAQPPPMAGAGLLLAPSPRVRFAGSAAWRSLSNAGPGAFDTWSWSAGAAVGSGRMPIRLGGRGGQLPFRVGTKGP